MADGDIVRVTPPPPGSGLHDARVMEITGAGHYPHETYPAGVLAAVQRYSTAPSRHSETRWRTVPTTPVTAPEKGDL